MHYILKSDASIGFGCCLSYLPLWLMLQHTWGGAEKQYSIKAGLISKSLGFYSNYIKRIFQEGHLHQTKAPMTDSRGN